MLKSSCYCLRNKTPVPVFYRVLSQNRIYYACPSARPSLSILSSLSPLLSLSSPLSPLSLSSRSISLSSLYLLSLSPLSPLSLLSLYLSLLSLSPLSLSPLSLLSSLLFLSLSLSPPRSHFLSPISRVMKLLKCSWLKSRMLMTGTRVKCIR